MRQCKQCGTNLPDNARFCLQCGTEATPPAEPAPDSTQAPLDFVQPALAGGMALGILSTVPPLHLGNCICCMWVVGGGALTSYLLMKQRPRGITYGDGAFGGVLSGLFGAIVSTILQIPIRYIVSRGFDSQQALEEWMRELPGLDGPMRDLLLRVASPEISAVTLLFTFITNLLFFSLFAMAGGILTVAVMERKRRDQGVI